MQYCQDLSKMQEDLKKSVSHAISEYAEFQICNDHLLRTVSILKKRNSSLKQEVISLWTQLQLQKDSPTVASEAVELLKNSEPLKGLHNVLAAEEMLLQCQQQNKEISKNLATSSELLNHYVIRAEESEKAKDEALVQLDECKRKIQSLQGDLEISTENLKHIGKEHAKEIEKREEKETVKNGQCDVGIQYEVVDQSEDTLPTAAKYEKSTNTAGQDFEEKYFEHVSVQTDCQGSGFSNFDKSQDACFQPSTGFVCACVSDTCMVCGKNSSVDLHGNCSSTNESKRDKGNLPGNEKDSLSENEKEVVTCNENHINYGTQISDLSDPIMGSDHLEESVDIQWNIADEGDDFTGPHYSKVIEEHADENLKATLSNKKEISSENEAPHLTERCNDKSIDTMEFCSGAVSTPEAVKRQHEGDSIGSPVHRKKRICSRSKLLHDYGDIGYACSPDRCANCVDKMLNVDSLVSVEPHKEVATEGICYCKKWISNSPKGFVTSTGLRDCDSFLTACRHPSTAFTSASKKDDYSSDVLQENKTTKSIDNPGKNIGSIKDVAKRSCCYNVLNETKVVNKYGGETSNNDDAKVLSNLETYDETSLNNVTLSWDLEFDEEMPLQDEKLRYSEAVEHNYAFRKQADYTGNIPNASSVISGQSQITLSDINKKDEGSVLYDKKQKLTSDETGSCSKDCFFRSSALRSPVVSDACLETVRKAAFCGRVSPTCDADKSSKFCEMLVGDLKNDLGVSNAVPTPAEVKKVKRHIEDNDAETTASSQKKNFGKNISYCDTNSVLSREKFSDTCSSDTVQETFISDNKQLSSEANTCATHNEKESTTVNLLVTFLPSEETPNTFSENEDISQQHCENNGKCDDYVECNPNTSCHHEPLGESKEGKKNCNETVDETDGASAMHYHSCGSGDGKASIQIDSSENNSDCTRKVLDVDSTNERNTQTVKGCIQASGRPALQSLNKTIALPSYDQSKPSRYKFKPPLLKNIDAGILYKTDKTVHCEKRNVFCKDETSQIDDTEQFRKNRETCVSNEQNMSRMIDNFTGASEQKKVKGENPDIAACDKNISGYEVLCGRNYKLTETLQFVQSCEACSGDMDGTTAVQSVVPTGERKATQRDHKLIYAETGMHEKKRIFEKGEILQLGNNAKKACFPAKHVDCKINTLDANITLHVSSESEVSKSHSIDVERDICASDSFHQNSNETSSGSPLKTSVQCSDLSAEKNDFSEVPLITNPEEHGNNEKTVSGLRSDVGKDNFTSVFSALKGEKSSGGETVVYDKELCHNECKSFILTNTAGCVCSFEDPIGNVRNKQNMGFRERTGAPDYNFEGTNVNTTGNNRKQSSEDYFICSDDVGAACLPESAVVKYKNIKSSLSACADQTLTNKSNVSSASEVSRISKELGENRKFTESSKNSLNQCKYLETTVRSHISTASMGTTVADLQDETVMGNGSFSKKDIDCVDKMRNVSISSASTVETKVIERHFIETKYETVVCEKKQMTREAQVSHGDNRKSYCPFKAPIVKFSAMRGAGNGSCKQSYVCYENKVPKLGAIENCNGSGKTALNANTCSAAIQKTPKKCEVEKMDTETLSVQETKFRDTGGTIFSPEKHVVCAINTQSVCPHVTDEPDAARSDISGKNKGIFPVEPEASDRAEVIGDSGKNVDFLKTPIVRYLPTSHTFTTAHKENIIPKEGISNNNSQ